MVSVSEPQPGKRFIDSEPRKQMGTSVVLYAIVFWVISTWYSSCARVQAGQLSIIADAIISGIKLMLRHGGTGFSVHAREDWLSHPTVIGIHRICNCFSWLSATANLPSSISGRMALLLFLGFILAYWCFQFYWSG